MSTKYYHRRPNTGEEEETKEVGHVEFADPVNNKLPIDTAEHIRASWDYVNHGDNATKYDEDELNLIRSRIQSAAEEHGVEIGRE